MCEVGYIYFFDVDVRFVVVVELCVNLWDNGEDFIIELCYLGEVCVIVFNDIGEGWLVVGRFFLELE